MVRWVLIAPFIYVRLRMGMLGMAGRGGGALVSVGAVSVEVTVVVSVVIITPPMGTLRLGVAACLRH